MKLFTMKTNIIKALIFALVAVNFGYAQNKSEVRVYYNVLNEGGFFNQGEGGPYYKIKNPAEFGVKYLYNISNSFQMETGVNYFNSNVIEEHTLALIGGTFPPDEKVGNLNLISIPIYANYTLWDYFFVNGGPSLDFQLSKEEFSSQSGIGFQAGIGAKYPYKDFLFFVNPAVRMNSIIPFEKDNNHYNLSGFTIQTGVGYKF